MESRDLGVIDAPMLIFGGPYGNLEATRALLAEARRRRIPPERMLCTGDVVAYCADPAATVALLREARIPVLMGNCEESVGTGAADCGCGFAEGSSCDLLSAQWYAHAAAALDDDAKAWMRDLPRRIRFVMAGRRFLAIHGGISEINRFIFPATPAAEKAAELDAAGAEGVIGGHSGLPFSEIVDGRLWHNAGVIGLPANDGGRRVWYGTLTPDDAGGIVVRHHGLAYDHDTAARKMRERGLPAAYAEALMSGLWPADDMMPPADRRRRGLPLDPPALTWPRPAGARPDAA